MKKLLYQKIISGDRRALGQAITLTESSKEKDLDVADDLIAECLKKPSRAIRIGITGSPGAGKSSLIEALGMECIRFGAKVAVLAIDPTSPVIGGSILGDKTRMVQLSAHENAFVRPSPSGNSTGGVLSSTRNSILFCEAAGFDLIFVETVGAGQSEYAVASMVDLVVFVHLPNSGDELQGVKRGVLELSDIIVVSKADGETLQGAQIAKADLQRALSLSLSDDHRGKSVDLVSARSGDGVAKLREKIELLFNRMEKNGSLKKKRAGQWLEAVQNEIVAQMKKKILESSKVKKLLLSDKVKNSKFSSRRIARSILR